MAKKGVYKISGNTKPTVGKKEFYIVDQWYPATPLSDRNLAKVTWELFIKTDNGFRATNVKKKGINHFTFGKNASKYVYKIEGYLHEPEGNSPMSLIVYPQKNEEKKIVTEKNIKNVVLTYENGSTINKTLSYRDRLQATAICEGLEGEKIVFKLWEDDEAKNGHNNKNQFITKSPPVEVNKFGKAKWSFSLNSTFISLANKREDDKSKHEYYVTAEFSGKILEDSQNVNFTNPEYKIEQPQQLPQRPKRQPRGNSSPKPKQESPKASTRPSSPNNQPDKKGKISSIKLVDIHGKQFSKNPKFGDVIKLIIEGKDVVGQPYRLKLWEHDNTGENDLLYNQEHTFKSDKQEVYIRLLDEYRTIGEIGNNSKKPDSGEYWTGNHQEIFAEVIFLGIKSESQRIDIDLKEEPKKEIQHVSPAKVEKAQKEKFEKVVGLGKEAILYISSEIATEIKVDRDNKIISYPDNGGYNDILEYKEGNKIYTKKLPNGSSAFPLYKMYIYRGSKIGEAVKKLKQDLNNNTRENAESTILNVARHAQKNNKNYGSEGPLPPNTITTLYRIRYMKAKNYAGKYSFRYRIVSDDTSNMKPVTDVSKEVSYGAMALGSRGSISIDPWNSAGLVGCVGIRNSDGTPHSSCKKEYPNQDSINYKFIYHALNNYLETVIPELTGVYGRRGYSSDDKVPVLSSNYKEEIKVFVLADPLPELNNCKLNLKKDGREKFYNEFGESAVKMVENQKKSNKFKGLYIIAQRRQENGLKLIVPNNNPMNIKDSGDLGKSDLYTREVFNGKEVYINDGFGKFSTVEKGFEGYLKLLNRNFNDAYISILDDNKTIDDFLSGMQDTGRKGAYATDPNYKSSIKSIFNGVVKDYKEILNYKLCKAKLQDEKNKIKKDIELLNKLK
ncbi:glucosaminidase domain-containing protein [Chryseobacterium sp. RLHN22]|uniref:glucosaminidase domain-containing protein n=1 Tax=Chryseobacterium sp. RLHN22 TaxID=3437885 RepID=UPI003D9BE7C8